MMQLEGRNCYLRCDKNTNKKDLDDYFIVSKWHVCACCWIQDTSVGVSVFTLTALSYDRYAAIVRPVQSFTGGPQSKRVIVTLFLIWFLSLGLALPGAINSHIWTTTYPSRDGTIFINGTIYKEIEICYPFPHKFGPIYPKVI